MGFVWFGVDTMIFKTESGETVTAEELKAEFEQLQREQPEEYNYSFNDYIYFIL